MRILLAIDDSVCSEAAIATVLKQAKLADTEALVLHVIDSCRLTPISVTFAEGPLAAQQLSALRLQWHEEANALVTHTAERLEAAHIQASTLVREGDPKAIILEEASQWRADLIVLGSHGRRGINRFLLGSISDAVARHAPCSTLIVRPQEDAILPLSQPEFSRDIHESKC